MKRNFIFSLTLLTTFSMVNALTNFGACPDISDPPTFSSVTINPDPVVPGKSLDITVSGKLNVDVFENSPNVVFEAAFLDPDYVPIGDIHSVEFCKSKDIKCPVKAGTEFSTALTVTAPADLGEETSIVADVYDGTNFLVCSLSDPIS